MAKPGVMFYFDVRPCIKRLDINEKGRLFEAILDYGEFGIVPDLDGSLGVAWDFIQPKLDRDADRYEKQVTQKQYAVYSREVKKAGGDPITFDAWKALPDVERNRPISADIERYPTTPTNPTIATTSNSTPSSTSAPSIAGSAPMDGRLFTRFWEQYPKKIDREAAWTAWKLLNPSTDTAGAILNALEAWKKSGQWTEDGGRFIPDASNFLTKGYWRSTPPPAKKEETPKGASGELGAAELEAIQRILKEGV